MLFQRFLIIFQCFLYAFCMPFQRFLIVFECFLYAFCMLFVRFFNAFSWSWPSLIAIRLTEPDRGQPDRDQADRAWSRSGWPQLVRGPVDEPPGPYGGAFWMHRHPSFLSERVTRSHAREGRGAAAAGRVQRSGPKTNRVQVTQVDFGSKWSGKNRFSVCLLRILGTLLAHILHILRHSGQL